jgi:hypothetical protein
MNVWNSIPERIFDHVLSICGAHIESYAIGGTFEDKVTGR